ncbi:MAG: 16S rRNA (cytidine(1402)-2'-O)-methyltransferase [bacterium]
MLRNESEFHNHLYMTSERKQLGTLFVVATPIGNLDDISTRALNILQAVDIIFCEDTRQTKKILDAYDFSVPLSSYNEHNHDLKADEIVKELKSGKQVALVSDAGTPAISDPGSRLVEKVVVETKADVQAIPGPSAVISALSISGFPTQQFVFKGYVPVKKGRETFFNELAETTETTVLYESPFRIIKTVAEISSRQPDREIMVARELTKMYEEKFRGTTAEVSAQIKDKKLKGEFVIVLRKL